MTNEITSMKLAVTPGNGSLSGRSVNVEGAKLPVQGQDSPSQEAKPVSKSEIQEAVSQVNDFVQSVHRDLAFSMDDSSGKTVIKVIDSDSGKLVRQIPSEEVLAIASVLKEVTSNTKLTGNVPQGMLFSDTT